MRSFTRSSGILVLFLVAVSASALFAPLWAAGPRLAIGRLAIGILPGTPTIPWVTAGDNGWRGGQPLFEITDAKDPGKWAKGWMAVTSQNILIRVAVHHAAHLSSGGGFDLWSGDSIQFGIDPLGRGTDQPPLVNVQKELEKRFGKKPAGDRAREIQNVRNDLENRNKSIAAGDVLDMRGEDQDFCVGTVGANVSARVYTYYSGHGGVGEVNDVDARVVRDAAAQLTTYDVAIPWSKFGVPAGLSPLMKVSFQINTTKGKLREQARLYWGRGVGGRFSPWKFHAVALGEPPAGTKVSSLLLVKPEVSGADDYVEALAAVRGVPGTISAQLGAGLTAGAGASGAALERYRIRAYPGALRGSTNFTASLVNANGKITAEVATRVFDDSSSNWYVFAPKSDTGPSVIGMADWMDAPAGKHGPVQIQGKRMVFADGTPVKFWGVGMPSYQGGLALDHEAAKAFAAWYAKWGVNSVRNGILFGTGWMGIGDPNDTTKLDPGMLDRFDYSFSALKDKGVYYNIIAFWTEGLRPGDKSKVLAYDEAKTKAAELDSFAEDIQDLRIAAVVNFLRHKNPYTGLTYAQDAALSCIEIRNEQDIYWYTVAPNVAACPTYLAKIRKQFCDWLRARYGTQEKLVAAWGPQWIGSMQGSAKDESLDKNNLHPVFNAWFFSFGANRRMLDTAEFLYETQTKYYTRFTAAIRATGYKGLVVGSNWQAGGGVSHLYNLLSDRVVGRIDRHNYCGGAGMPGMSVGMPEDNSSMLWQPGRAILSAGLQQMSDRPFGLSEWMIQAPNEWVAEGAPVIGFYGFGLQGWAAAYEGNNTEPKFDAVYGTWLHTQTPINIGLYPAVARSIYRGDVREGATIACRRFSLADLRRGKLDFSDVVAQSGDVKSISSTVPIEALAAGRVVLELVDKTTPSQIPDMSRQIREKVIVSNTGQLAWHYPRHEESYFTVNTDGTKGLVGFAPNREFTLGGVRLQVDNKFAVLLVTALDRGKTLANTRSALITAVARERNSGMAYNQSGSLTALGTAPALLEPILGSATFERKIARVYLLDHDGKRTRRTAKIGGGRVTIDGVGDKTMYYEVVFE